MPINLPLPNHPIEGPPKPADMSVPLAELSPRSFKAVNLDEVWVLYYRHGMSVNNMKMFHLKGTMREARARAERHCAIMGYRFTFLRPLITDIDYEERWKYERGMEPLGA
jgi:hypothetical protein